MSTYANKSVQEVQNAVGDSPRFMQLYLSKNWDFNKMVIEESVKAGFTGFFLTVDALVSGYREANLRTNFTYPVPLAFFNEWNRWKG
jgi:L-lactate dehydrogenase (FMN-dependent) and related alpha-hydroxy acid dehydrogenases